MNSWFSCRVEPDTSPQSPRDWCNLWHLCLSHKKYSIGDQDAAVDFKQFSSWDEVEDFLKTERKACCIEPVSMTDHSSISLYRGKPKDSWDSGTVGFAYVTEKDLVECYGEKWQSRLKDIYNALDMELEAYTQYLNGEVWCCIVRDRHGNVVDSCGDFYSISEAEEYGKALVNWYSEHNNDPLYEALSVLRQFQDWRTGKDVRTMPEIGLETSVITKSIDVILKEYGLGQPEVDCMACENFNVETGRCQKVALAEKQPVPCEFKRKEKNADQIQETASGSGDS